MPRLDLASIAVHMGSGYPAPFDQPVAGRERRRLGDAGGLTQFGVNLLRLPPGAWSSQRHWHSAEDEFVYVLSGELTLVTDAGAETLRPGDCIAFPKGRTDGHHLVNRGDVDATCLEVGSRVADDFTTYPDIDLLFDPAVDAYTHRDGTPYPTRD
ncbi:MAG TPA: cupin domain-containing protein [Casimicrobiaceae bacterium]|jgi:uncharacterized cupin superfamily protein